MDDFRKAFDKAVAALWVADFLRVNGASKEAKAPAVSALLNAAAALADAAAPHAEEGRIIEDLGSLTAEEAALARRMILGHLACAHRRYDVAEEVFAKAATMLPPAKATFTASPAAPDAPAEDVEEGDADFCEEGHSCCGDMGCDKCHPAAGEVADGPTPEQEIAGLAGEVAYLQGEVDRLRRLLRDAASYAIAGADCIKDGVAKA